MTAELPGYSGPVRMVWPVLASDGRDETKIAARDRQISVELDGRIQTFKADGASSVVIGEELFGSRNGNARLAIAEYPAGTPARLVIQPGS